MSTHYNLQEILNAIYQQVDNDLDSNCVDCLEFAYINFTGLYTIITTDEELQKELNNEAIDIQSFKYMKYQVNGKYYSSNIEMDTNNLFTRLYKKFGYKYGFSIKIYDSNRLTLLSFLSKSDPTVCKIQILENLEQITKWSAIKINILTMNSSLKLYMKELKNSHELKSVLFENSTENLLLDDIYSKNVNSIFDYSTLPFHIDLIFFKPIHKEIIYLMYNCMSKSRISEFLDISMRTISRSLKEIRILLNCKSNDHIIPELLKQYPMFKKN